MMGIVNAVQERNRRRITIHSGRHSNRADEFSRSLPGEMNQMGEHSSIRADRNRRLIRERFREIVTGVRAMDYEISVSDDKSYVTVRVHRPITRQLVREFNRQMVEQANRYGVNHFLFDVRHSANVESTLGNYLIAYEDADKVEFSRSGRFAIVHDPSDRSHDFIMTVANNAGFNLMLFTEEQDAIEWLCK